MNNVEKAILEHAKSVYPNESCGVIIVFKGKELYVPCENKSVEPEKNFIISPHDYANAEDDGEIVKIVHSHPKINPKPSQADLVGIEQSGLPWIIVNPLTGEFTETKPSGYVAPLIGREFSHGLLDCYSLIVDYYKRVLDIELPHFFREEYWWENGENLYVENFSKAGFEQVSVAEIKEHDGIIMMSQSSTPNHAGVYVGNNQMIHHLQGRLSSRDVYGGYWLKNTWAVVRHKELM